MTARSKLLLIIFALLLFVARVEAYPMVFPNLPLRQGTNCADGQIQVWSLTTAGGKWVCTTIAGGGDALVANPLSQFASTTSAELAGVISNETGSGVLVFGTAPNITAPTGIVKADVGLGSVDNTSDAGKPVSTAQQTALDLKANLAGPTFTGTPTLPTGTIASGSFLTTAIVAPGTPGAGKGSIYVDSTSKNLAVKDDAGVVKHGVQTKSAVSNSFATAIADDGTVTVAQPSFSNLSGSVAAGQMPALTGDVTTSAGGVATTVVNLPDGVTQAGHLLITDIAAPASPSASHLKIFGDSTDLRFHDKNAAGTIGTTVVADTGASNNFLTAVSAAGVISKAQPAFSNLSGSATTSQLPAALANQTSINGLAITASTGTLTITNAKTLSVSNILTLAGTDSTTMTFPSSSATVGTLGLNQTVTGIQTLSPTARSSGVASYFTLNIPADTAQTAATESIGYQHVTASRQWATTGTVALQRENFFAGPTYTSASASQTFTDAFTLYATPPVAGSNAIFTRGHTLGIVDSTSAASSVTGGLVVSTTLGTTATSVGIGAGNVNAGGNGTFGGTLSVTGHATLEGVTSTGATGTAKFVFDTTPTIATPVLNHPTIGISGTAASSHVLTVGSAPTCAFTSGGGTGPSCAMETGSTDHAGTMTITTGSGSPAAVGTITLTFNATMGTNSPVCVTSLTKGATDWLASSVVRLTTQSTTAPVFTWNNNSVSAAVALTASTNYKISYICFAK